MKTHIENIPANRVLYMRRTGAYGAENNQLMQNMKDWIDKHNLWEGGAIYGIAWDNAATTPPEKCRYDVCLVTDVDIKDDTVLCGALPPGWYLVFEIPHTAEAVKVFWASVINAVGNEKKPLDKSRPILERYKPALVEKGYCEFCVPIL